MVSIMVRSEAKTRKANSQIKDAEVQGGKDGIRIIISPDNKEFNSFVKFVAEMVDKYGDEVLREANAMK